MNIFICCDGTWNTKDNPDDHTGKPCPTNVRRFFDAVKKAGSRTPGQGVEIADQDPDQIAYYTQGVGNAWYGRFRGGLSGYGTAGIVRAGYRFLMEHVRDPSTRIFLIGFSRGAFAARSIAGMIQHCGLLTPDDQGDDRARVKTAYRCYRKRGSLPATLAKTTRWDTRVEFVGVWDTVGGLTLPVWGKVFHILGTRRPHDIDAPRVIRHAYHAIAIDEQRAAYTPELWHVDHAGRPELEQTWFRGVHADVGGGYPERGLGNITLAWIIEKARSAGAKFDDSQVVQFTAAQTPKLHDSLPNVTWLAGVWPRRVPYATSTTDPHYDPSCGYLHQTVVQQAGPLDNGAGGGQCIRTLAPQEQVVVKIGSRPWWNTTGIVLEADSEYQLNAEGTWTDWGRKIGPAGEVRPWWPSWLLRMGSARWFELVGTVASPPQKRSKSEFILRALWYAFVEDPAALMKEQFKVGGERSFSPKATGVLSCYANDHWLFYGNNAGSVNLTIARKTSAKGQQESAR